MATTREIMDHYATGDEAGRLGQGAGLVEYARTQEIIMRHLAGPPALVYGIGGGPGAYATWLLGRGYEVHLVDPVPLHVERAQESMRRIAGSGWTATVGDARDLKDTSAPGAGVLLLGPLYHLTERDDRVLALTHACRLLRPGGMVFRLGEGLREPVAPQTRSRSRALLRRLGLVYRIKGQFAC